MSTINLNMTLCPGYDVEINKYEEIVFTGPLAEILFGTITSVEDSMLPPTLTDLRNYLFYNDIGLTTVNLTKIQTVGIFTFSGCSLTAINMPNLESAGMQAFSYNPMTSIELPKLIDIGSQMFQGCENLKTAIFNSAENIYTRAFYNCANLDTLVLNNESGICTWNGVSPFFGTKIESGEGYIYVPASLVDSYKESSGWSDFASQIRSVDELEV